MYKGRLKCILLCPANFFLTRLCALSFKLWFFSIQLWLFLLRNLLFLFCYFVNLYTFANARHDITKARG